MLCPGSPSLHRLWEHWGCARFSPKLPTVGVQGELEVFRVWGGSEAMVDNVTGCGLSWWQALCGVPVKERFMAEWAWNRSPKAVGWSRESVILGVRVWLSWLPHFNLFCMQNLFMMTSVMKKINQLPNKQYSQQGEQLSAAGFVPSLAYRAFCCFFQLWVKETSTPGPEKMRVNYTVKGAGSFPSLSQVLESTAEPAEFFSTILCLFWKHWKYKAGPLSLKWRQWRVGFFLVSAFM